MKEIILYTTGCPHCVALKTVMREAGIEPTKIVDDLDTITEMGMMSVPQLEVDGKRMQFFDATLWVQAVKNGEVTL